MVLIDHLSKTYGTVTAVDNLSLRLPAGQVHAVLGPNGAGKTTTVRILATLTIPTSGTATIGGYDVITQPLEVKRQIGVVHQTLNFDPELTGEESLLVHGMLYGMPRRAMQARMKELIEFAGLPDAAHRRVSTYSGGMKRRLSVARAMMHNPRVILLDEPTVGLDAHARRKVLDLVRRLRSEGRTIILTTHYIEEAEVLADHVVIIDHGQAIAEGSPQELIAREGSVAVDCAYPTETKTAFFETRDAAASFISKLDMRTTVRHANLEDVFIRLTGRRVNPNEQEGEVAHVTGHGGHTAGAHHS
jgi:ABC-2 type transport system ATP-binding protein